MGKSLLAIIILVTGGTALSRPWVGICSYYLLAILGPQYIWYWNFEGLRVSFVIAICTLAGLAFGLLKGRYDFRYIRTRQNFWLAVLWFCVVFSYFFGSFANSGHFIGLSPDQLYSITNTIFFFYFCSSLEINELRKLRFLVIIFAFSTIYLSYWANNQYFSQNWNQFNLGRLMGPSSADGGAIYQDENAFAMLFVTGLPFVYYLGWELRKIWQRLAFWLLIPLGWHAIFLTGSRGGLLGIGVGIICIVLLSNRKFLVLPLVLLFLLFYQWQAGDVMESRRQTIVNNEEERSAGDRLTAWKGGMKMVANHPITGVGLGAFAPTLPRFVESRNMVAHNTFVQFAAESGIGAGLAYLMVIYCFYKNSRQIRYWCHENATLYETRQVDLYNSACTVSFAGLVVCSMFLSLNTYEIFFVLLIFNNALLHICRQIDSKLSEVNPMSMAE